jgi:hypothetical protein
MIEWENIEKCLSTADTSPKVPEGTFAEGPWRR